MPFKLSQYDFDTQTWEEAPTQFDTIHDIMVDIISILNATAENEQYINKTIVVINLVPRSLHTNFISDEKENFENMLYKNADKVCTKRFKDIVAERVAELSEQMRKGDVGFSDLRVLSDKYSSVYDGGGKGIIELSDFMSETNNIRIYVTTVRCTKCFMAEEKQFIGFINDIHSVGNNSDPPCKILAFRCDDTSITDFTRCYVNDLSIAKNIKDEDFNRFFKENYQDYINFVIHKRTSLKNESKDELNKNYLSNINERGIGN